jgi:hypothetical protein
MHPCHMTAMVRPLRLQYAVNRAIAFGSNKENGVSFLCLLAESCQVVGGFFVLVMQRQSARSRRCTPSMVHLERRRASLARVFATLRMNDLLRRLSTKNGYVVSFAHAVTSDDEPRTIPSISDAANEVYVQSVCCWIGKDVVEVIGSGGLCCKPRRARPEAESRRMGRCVPTIRC